MASGYILSQDQYKQEGAILVQVNRRYWLQLKRPIELHGRHYTFDVCLVPQYLPSNESIWGMGVLEHLVHAALSRQGDCSEAPRRRSKYPAILFRSQWPPKLEEGPPGYVYVHQQASLP